MSIRKSLVWSYGGQAANLTFSFLVSVVVARLLSPSEFGVFAYAMAITAIITIFTSLNLGSYIVREDELSPDALRALFTLNSLMTLLFTGAILAVAAFEWRINHQAQIAAVLALGSIAPIISVFEFVPASLFQREMNFRILSLVGIGRNVVSGLVAITAAASGFGVKSLVIGPIVGALCSTAFYVVRRRRDLLFVPTRRGLRPALVFGVQIMSISGVAQLTQRLSDIGLGQLLGLSALGLYSRAANLSNLIFANVYGQATGVVFVRMSQDLRERGTLRETFVLSLRMITAAIWPLMAGVAVLSRPLIHTVYGAKWDGAAAPLTLLMMYYFVALGFGMNWELFVLRRETARQTRFEFIRAATGLTLFLAGCFFSITAAAAGRVAEGIVGYFLYRPHIDRLAGTEKGELEGVFVESLLLTAIAVSPSFVLMAIVGWRFDASPPLVALSAGLGIAAWATVLARRKHPLYAELMRVRAKLRRAEPSLDMGSVP